jgi:hypothetical protein
VTICLLQMVRQTVYEGNIANYLLLSFSRVSSG